MTASPFTFGSPRMSIASNKVARISIRSIPSVCGGLTNNTRLTRAGRGPQHDWSPRRDQCGQCRRYISRTHVTLLLRRE